MDDYIRSLEHLEEYRDQFDEIWPSHGDIPIAPDVVPRLRDGALDILAGRLAGSPAELFGNPISVYDLGFSSFLCDR